MFIVNDSNTVAFIFYSVQSKYVFISDRSNYAFKK